MATEQKPLAPEVADSGGRHGELRRLLTASVEGHAASCILLSGGLDTSILAHLARPFGLRAAVTVLANPDAPDGPFAERVARRYGYEHHVVVTDLEGLLQEAEDVVRVLRTFDPMEIRNSVVVARGLKEAARLGYRTAMTGDGADELFAGYSYMWSMPEAAFQAYEEHLARVMRFSSIPMGAALRVDVKAPYTDPGIVRFALSLEKTDKVGLHEGATYGKFILRLAFPEVEARWRGKDPIEVGSGSARLPAYFATTIPPEEFADAKEQIALEDRVEIRDPEHLAYYRLFRRIFGDGPPLVRFGDDPCPKCGYQLPSHDSNFCMTCGAWPARGHP